MKNVQNAQATVRSVDAGNSVRPRNDIVMEYVVMGLTALCLVAGIGQFIPAITQNAFEEAAQATAQNGLGRCEAPAMTLHSLYLENFFSKQ